MRRIVIDDRIRGYAQQFRADLDSNSHGRKSPKMALQELLDDTQDVGHRTYIEELIKDWDDLIIAEPESYDVIWIPKYEKIIKPNDEGAGEFFEKVRVAMRYELVQKTIYPHYINKLGIRTCVYCNAQYAFAVEDYMNYELDHVLPESEYPFLCTTFMNLQPSCTKCNQIKSKKIEKPGKKLFRLYAKSGDNLNPVHFELDNKSMIIYLATLGVGNLQLKLTCLGDNDLENGYEYFFNLKALYKAHIDEIEELIWKRMTYNGTIQRIYEEQFSKLGLTNSDYRRYIVGNYTEKADVHKRPLAQMTQDIARQLGLI